MTRLGRQDLYKIAEVKQHSIFSLQSKGKHSQDEIKR